jgi:hypothetical protein
LFTPEEKYGIKPVVNLQFTFESIHEMRVFSPVKSGQVLALTTRRLQRCGRVWVELFLCLHFVPFWYIKGQTLPFLYLEISDRTIYVPSLFAHLPQIPSCYEDGSTKYLLGLRHNESTHNKNRKY